MLYKNSKCFIICHACCRKYSLNLWKTLLCTSYQWVNISDINGWWYINMCMKLNVLDDHILTALRCTQFLPVKHFATLKNCILQLTATPVHRFVSNVWKKESCLRRREHNDAYCRCWISKDVKQCQITFSNWTSNLLYRVRWVGDATANGAATENVGGV